MLTLAKAKILFETGVFKSFYIEKIFNEWLLVLVSSDLQTIVDARTHQPRAFKSLDSAVFTAESIGFCVNKLVLK